MIIAISEAMSWNHRLLIFTSSSAQLKVFALQLFSSSI